MRARLLVAVVLLGACASAGKNGGSAPDASVPDARIPDAAPPDAEPCAGSSMLGQACSAGVGACMATGQYVCDASNMVVCDAVPGQPIAELCNGIDDDCDGTPDNGLNLGAPCDGPDSDLCQEGVIQCDGSGNAVCSDTTGDSVEQCNGVDDDCNGTIDDPWPIGQACTAGVGACMTTGTYQCTSLSSAACNAVAGTPTAELCGDGIDQDCNGSDVSCPTNDFPSGAIDISGGGTFSVDMSAAHDDYASCRGSAGRDVFYTFTLGAPEVVYVDTLGSNFDTVITIAAGACTAPGAQVACNDDSQCATPDYYQSQGAFALGAGQYCLIADQYSSSTSGALVLRFTRGGRTGTALPKEQTNATVTGNTTGGTSSQASTSCQANASGPDIGYFFTECPATRSIAASTCSNAAWDTILTLSGPAALAACSDDACSTQSQITATSSTGAGLYWLTLDGWNGANGAYTLTYSN